MAAFIAEHNLPFTVMNHLPKLIQAVCTDSQIAKQFKCSRTKSTALVTNVIGVASSSSLIKDLRENKFSIILDESTDRATIKHLAVVARIVKCTDKKLTVRDEFVTLIEVRDATSEALYIHLVEFFCKNNIPYKDNMIGYAGDGANNMMGSKNSLKTRLTNDIPGLFVLKCICHSFHLCASYACLKLPTYVEDFTRNVYNYINNSPKRMCELKDFQEKEKLKPHKMLHPAQTRWLSLLSVVNRLILHFPALKKYFLQAIKEDKIGTATLILETIEFPFTLLYLQFLSFALPFFVDLNLEMQTESIKIHVIYDRIGTIYKEILNCFIKKECMQNKKYYEINYTNPNLYLPVNDIYVGGKVLASITSLLAEKLITYKQVEEFKTRCLGFYVESVNQINKRFPFRTMQPLQYLKIIDPKTVQNHEVSSLGPMASQFSILFKDLDLDNVDREWRQLSFMEFEKDECQIMNYWFKVMTLKKGDDTIMFPALSKLITNIMTLPHSSANVERIFSMVNTIKSKDRNRLNTENLIGLLQAKRALKDSECFSFDFNENYINLFNQEMYNFKE